MKKLISCALAAAALVLGASAVEETDLPWQFSETDRAGKYAPLAAVAAEWTSSLGWLHPAWVEVPVSGVSPSGLVLIIR
jgi:hypothetical protein